VPEDRKTIDPNRELAKKHLLRRDVIIIVSILAVAGLGYAAIDIAGTNNASHNSGTAQMADLGSMGLDRLIENGNQLMDAGKYEAAIAHYTRALEVDPSLVDVRIDRGACYYALKEYPKAINDFERGLESEPDHAIAHFNMGITYHSLGEDSLMVAYWKRYLELSPDGDLSDRVREAIKEFIGPVDEGQ